MVDLEKLVEPVTRGDPESPLRWTCKSVRRLAEELGRQGHVDQLPGGGGFVAGVGLQPAGQPQDHGRRAATRTAMRSSSTSIARCKRFLASKQPVISVDTKKKELVGDFKNGGREWRPQGQPEKVRVHDFLIPELGRATPYGVYDLAQNTGWVSVGSTTTRRHSPSRASGAGGESMGQPVYPQGPATADHGGWRRQQRTAPAALESGTAEAGRRDGPADRGLPLSAGHQQVEQDRASAVLASSARTGAGKPLLSFEVIVNLIAATTTAKGLKVHAELDSGTYPAGTKDRPTRNLPHQSEARTSSMATGTTKSIPTRLNWIVYFLTVSKPYGRRFAWTVAWAAGKR